MTCHRVHRNTKPYQLYPNGGLWKLFDMVADIREAQGSDYQISKVKAHTDETDETVDNYWSWGNVSWTRLRASRE